MAQAAHRHTRPTYGGACALQDAPSGPRGDLSRSPRGDGFLQGPRGGHCLVGSAQLLSGVQEGFTLIELMVVIAIMAMLAAIVVPSFNLATRHRDRNTCAANLKAIGQALALFREEYGCYPPDATEFLWTPEAVQEYVNRYGVSPPGDHRLGTPNGAAYYSADDPSLELRGKAWDTGVHGLGLYALYYLGAYARSLPPSTLEPRFYDEAGGRVPGVDGAKGLSQFDWFKGSGYITRFDTFHCPSNGAKLDRAVLPWRQTPDQVGVPYLGEWGNYDRFYRRNFWREGFRPGLDNDHRNLFQPYPPVDTVVTWCPYHRSARPPSGPGQVGEVNPGDEDLVLFADGSVRRLVASRTNEPFRDPSGDFGYPQGPIM